MMTERFDIVIAGGGAAGMALALAIRHAAGGALSVAIFDPDLAADARGDARAYAIVAGAARFFDTIGVWQAMLPDAQPVTAMEITDSSLEELVRPLMLEFAGDAPAGGPPAHMLPNRVILSALAAQLQSAGVRTYPEPVADFRRESARMVAIAAGREVACSLLVAADGRASGLRRKAEIPYYGWSYPQTAIVGAIRHSLPHEGVAVQHFLPAGPFAMLPLKDPHQSAIVWSEHPAVAARLLAGDADDLVAEADRRAAGRFGVVTAVDNAQGFPLSLGIARSFIAPRMALLGDAAHGLHPLAGQGLNYGLRGAAALAEAIIDAARLGLDIGAEAALRPYESSRRPDVMAMALATESLHRLFSTDSGPVRLIRDLGLGLANRFPGFARAAMREAQGAGRLAPRAFRGEPV